MTAGADTESDSKSPWGSWARGGAVAGLGTPLDGATGISFWWKDHTDHHMNVFPDSLGPFYECDM